MAGENLIPLNGHDRIEEPNRTEVFSKERQLLSSLDQQQALKSEFERLALPHLSHHYTVAFYLTKDKAEAEDLVQETYLRAFRFFYQFQPGRDCRAWMLSILRNLFINRYREKKQELERIDWEEIDQIYESMLEQGKQAKNSNPEEIFFLKLMDDEVEKSLRELPEEYRTAIVLVDIEELSYEEAAKVMGCAIGTIRSRVSRGRRMLQVTLKAYAKEKGLIKE